MRNPTIVALLGMILFGSLFAQEILNNDSIMKLAKSGLSDEVIVNIVKTQPGNYSLGANDIAGLKKGGVSEQVITAMLKKSARGSPAEVSNQLGTSPTPQEDGHPESAFELDYIRSCVKGYTNDYDSNDFIKSVTDICTNSARVIDYTKTHPGTAMGIEKVRKVYIDKIWGAGSLTRAIRKTCVEIVDNPADADAVFKGARDTLEYTDDETDTTVTCHSGVLGGTSCNDGVVTTSTYCGTGGCSSTSRHNGVNWFRLYDSRTNEEVGWWLASDGPKKIAEALAIAVGCGKGNEKPKGTESLKTRNCDFR